MESQQPYSLAEDMPIAEQREILRLKALADLNIDDGPEESFDRIARLLRGMLNFPSSLVSLIDAEKHIFKSDLGNGQCYGNLDSNFCAIALIGTGALIVPDASTHDIFSDYPIVRGYPHLRAYWGTPLRTRSGYNIGTLSVVDFVPRWPNDRDLTTLADFGRLTIEYMELRAQATTDVLTGTKTRRAFQSQAERLFDRNRRSGTPLSCIMLDVDHFKAINDRYGHAAGDEVLGRVGNMMLASSRPDDVIGRIGGEEFAVVLPGATLREAFTAAERLRVMLETNSNSLQPVVTASFGVSEMIKDDGDFHDVLARADRAVYCAKNAGRNCTFSEPSETA